MRHCWLVDDCDRWHRVTGATLAVCPGWSFTSFYRGDAAILAYQNLADHERPQLVLMDYVMPGLDGAATTRALRALEGDNGHCTIVAHSSAAHGNAAILHHGGDLVVRKHANSSGLNPDLLAWMRNWNNV